jgi:hypothetical protein
MTAAELYLWIASCLFPLCLWVIALMTFKIRSLMEQVRHTKHAHGLSQDDRWATASRLRDLVEEIEAGRVRE